MTDPAAYTDYARRRSLIASELKKAHINSTFYGPSPSVWAANITKGNFVLTQHWSQTTISAYQLYNTWLNSDEIGNSAGNFERLKNPALNADLAKLAAQTTTAGRAEVPDADRAVCGHEPPGHPDRLRRRVRRVQLVELHRLAFGQEPV